jgi:uncharacterized protein YutE (UPF0331/DUF86 family)
VVKREIIAVRLGRLQEYLKILKGLKRYPQSKFSVDPLIRGSAERYLHLAIECCLDMGSHVIADRGLRKPEDYRDIILILGEAKIISPKFSAELLPMIGFRNRLVHDYLRLDTGEIYRILQTHLSDFQRFARAFQRFL